MKSRPIYPFDVERAIASWRRRYRYRRIFSREDLDELERHLRDQIADFVSEGVDERTAFFEAERKVGDASGAEDEYRKVYWGKLSRTRRLTTELHSTIAMLKNYVSVALRNLERHRGHTAVNVFGLTLGLTCVLLIVLYVKFELSFDRFFPHADQIYRVVYTEVSEGNETLSARSPVPMASALQDDIPEAIYVGRFWRSFQAVLAHEDRVFQEPGLYFADPAVMEMFSLELIAGDAETALDVPSSIVLTKSTATRYFGEDDPMGQVLEYDGYPGDDSLRFTVTGILPDLPPNTHLSFTALASLRGIETERNNWGSFKPMWTYVMLPRDTRPAMLENKLDSFVSTWFAPEDATFTLQLEPLTDIHLKTNYAGGFGSSGNTTYVVLLAAIGVFILLLACINFINLSTARSMNRVQEVRMRKVLGAGSHQLVIQFLAEAFIMVALSVVLALGATYLLVPTFNSLVGADLAFGMLAEGTMLLMLFGLVIVVGLLSGLYPAVALSRFVALTGKRSLGPNVVGTGLRQGLVVFQFTISTVLIVGTLTVEKQLDFIKDRDPGFDREQVVVLPYSSPDEPLLDALRQHPNVKSATVSQRVPANTISADGRGVLPEGFQEAVRVESYIVDDSFIETMGMELKAGRGFSRQVASDSSAFVISQEAVRQFGWGSPQNALGKRLQWNEDTGYVIGVVDDFPVASMREEISPVVLQMRPSEEWWRTFISVKIIPGDVTTILGFLEDTWREHAPDGAYEYFFLDDSFEALHQADLRVGRIFGVFALLGISIACLGLFGLASYMAQRRIREIGVRKVLGATVTGLTALLSREFAGLVTIAFLVAVPISYIIMDRWLDGFAIRVELSATVFAIAGLITLTVALLTVSFQTIKAALSDPVKSLRHE